MNIRIKKVFSIVLAVCLLVSVCSVMAAPVWAAETSESGPLSVAESQPAGAESVSRAEPSTPATPVAADVTVIREEESLRGEFEKHFLMSDGTYQAVVYSYPVHELVDGVWVEIASTNQNARSDVSPGNAQQNIIDNYVCQNHGVQDNNSVRLYIGNRSGNECRAFIRFATMPTIPEGATITAATMKVNLMAGTSSAANAKAYQVNGSWESATIQWSNMPGNGALLEDNISHNNKTKYEFSCLTAVQHWYDGSTTGQNENYGIMLKYADDTVADYNSVYSADCTDATMRPSMTISYQLMTVPADEISVQEGDLAQIPLPNTTKTITWTSSNADLATVNSNGVVRGIKAGKVTVTASVEDVAEYTYTVYVKIKEGAHRISCANTSYYLSVGGGMLENAGIYLKNSSNTGLPLYRQVWRIIYLGGGYYVIRPLHNHNMALHAKNGVSSVTTIGSDNDLASVPAENRWTIEWVDGGYVFKCQGDSAQTLRSLYNAPEVRVYTGEYMSSNNVFQWNFSDSPDIQPKVLLLNSKTGEIASNFTRGILPKQSTTLADLDLTATFVCSAKNIEDPIWFSSASSSISVNATTGVFKGDTVGNTATITAHYTYSGTDYCKSLPLVVVPFIEGTVYIKSSADETFLQVTNEDGENNHCTSGADMEQWNYTGYANQSWIFTLLGDGYFSIISAKSGLALSVPFGKSAVANVTLEQLPYEGNDTQKWKIEATEDYGYKIKAKSAEGQTMDLTIAVGTSVFNVPNGVEVQQREYISDGDLRDEWLFCEEIVDVGMSTDDCTGDCPHKKIGSYVYATQFYNYLVGGPSGPYTKTHQYNNSTVQTASPVDFCVNGAISNEIDFMIYIGHGHSAHDEKGNHMHYDCDLWGELHIEEGDEYTYCYSDGNVYTSDVKFGSGTSDLRWVWLYTCNFLHAKEDNGDKDGNPHNDNDFVSNADLAEMMNGAHLVMSHASRATLCSAMVQHFGAYLRAGMPIYEAYFKAGYTGEASVEGPNHYQKIMYIPQARYETIYSASVQYEYDLSDVEIAKRCIRDPY